MAQRIEDNFAGADELICPYCGYVQLCHEPDPITAHCCNTECENCGKTFEYAVTVMRQYYAVKLAKNQNEGE